MDTPTCKLCGAELIPQPDHPGKNIGDWWTHTPIRWELLGHSVAAYLPHDTEESEYHDHRHQAPTKENQTDE